MFFDAFKLELEKLATELRPHQEEAIRALSKSDALLLYHGLGSGKTLTSLSAADRLGLPLTMVGPAALKHNLPKEKEKHSIKADANFYTYNKPPEQGGGIVAFDEAHRMGQISSKRSRLVDILEGDKKLLMTGTPIRNRPSELIPIMRGLNIDVPRDVKAFNDKYIEEIEEDPGFFARVFRDVKPGVKFKGKNLKELGDLLTGKVHYHATGTDGFPSVVEEEILVDMTDKQQSAHDMAMKNNPSLAYKIRNGIAPSKTESTQLNAFLTASRQISNIPGSYNLSATSEDAPKIQRAADEVIKHRRDNPNYRGVTYSNFIDHGIRPMADELGRRGVSYGEFTGSLTDKEKARIISSFNSGEIEHLLISGAGAEGLDLKGVRLMQLMEPHWNEAVLDQAAGRAIRMGSHDHLPEDERSVTVQNLIARPKETGLLFKSRDKATDEYLRDRASEKQELNNQFLDVLRRVGSK
jgi:SNF2 family DNA or RNA helicase